MAKYSPQLFEFQGSPKKVAQVLSLYSGLGDAIAKSNPKKSRWLLPVTIIFLLIASPSLVGILGYYNAGGAFFVTLLSLFVSAEYAIRVRMSRSPITNPSLQKDQGKFLGLYIVMYVFLACPE